MVTVRGLTASMRWGYFHVAELSAYTVTKDSLGVWTLTATVGHVDAFRVTQRPLVFVAPHLAQAGRPSVWCWPVETLQIAGASLTATLGPPEK